MYKAMKTLEDWCLDAEMVVNKTKSAIMLVYLDGRYNKATQPKFMKGFPVVT
jgi:hypothetical protein